MTYEGLVPTLYGSLINLVTDLHFVIPRDNFIFEARSQFIWDNIIIIINMEYK